MEQEEELAPLLLLAQLEVAEDWLEIIMEQMKEMEVLGVE
jgi:hypothetical protein